MRAADGCGRGPRPQSLARPAFSCGQLLNVQPPLEHKGSRINQESENIGY